MRWILRGVPILLSAVLSAQAGGAGLFAGRAERRAAFKNEPVQQAVRLGLGWLIAHQAENGRFACATFAELDPPGNACDGAGHPAHDVGATALALLAILAGAEPGQHEAARLAADWLVSQLHEKSGRFASSTQDFLYGQAIATLALVEAHAVLGGSKYGEAAGHGLRYLESHRNPGAAWRYQPRDGDNDASVSSWCIAAFCAAAHAGIACSPEAVGEALAWLETVTNPLDGSVGYTERNQISSRLPGGHATKYPAEFGSGLVGAALHARAVALWPARDPLLPMGLKSILAKPVSSEPKARDHYTWFHAAAAFAGADRSAAQAWQKASQATLLKLQRKDGAYQGSWDANDVWGEVGGRIVSTAFAVLTLAAPWRQGAESLPLVLPDVVPFRSAFAKWQDGQIGAASAALDELLATDLPPEQLAIAVRAKWFATLLRHAAGRFAAGSDQLYPDLGQRLQRAEQLVVAFGADPVFAELRKVRDDLKAIPEAQASLDAARELDALLTTFDTRNPPKESSKRRALLVKFRKLLERYGKTPSAETIQKWVTYFDR